MIKKEWPTWLNGGLFAGIVYLIVVALAAIYIVILDVANISVILSRVYLLTLILEFVFYFVVGAIVAMILGSKKFRK
jgi:hypothetical protein